ncbi:MAG: class I SAM-dependent methyltransferase [Humidesulfovibrio sp.]|uniref:class I SAM-dependent methyltransferase n=1 Tax=Humidesulfovibrio sp. TaxID=2910988 RepID=UPI002735E1F2|nr:class I SAM-dependent methyltransferase [Humidesulfovibrio sp.]MDP2847061.1 class I SAM-dependent methyltransferase [Humidesulfovibrio sp.]
MNCRFCHTTLSQVFLDLGAAPPSNSFLKPEELNGPEAYYPLKLFVCPDCFLVQVDEVKSSTEIFSSEYVYFSSFSRTWLDHARAYVESALPRLGLGKDSLVMEIASNDGYLLQYVRKAGIPALGVEPTASTARAAREKGVDTLEEFFGVGLATRLASEGRQADLIIGNNVLAHVPDLNDFVGGLALALKPGGLINMEFPHLYRLVESAQFDTVYHEHFSYLSLTTVRRVFAAHGLNVFDVEELATHGGSLRIHARREADPLAQGTERLNALLRMEQAAGMQSPAYYQGFQERVERIKAELLGFLAEQTLARKKVAAYGAAAKGNTLLNFCGVKPGQVAFVCDASPHKQGLFLPGSRIPVLAPEAIREQKPDFVLILPWNIKDELMSQLDYIRQWGGRFVTPIPSPEIL